MDCLWSVDNDNIHAAEIATQHLVDQGFKRIGMIAGPAGITVSEDRIRGFRNVVDSAGMAPLIWNSGFGSHAAKTAAVAALSIEDRPDALVVLDDFMAMGVIQAARELHLSIPNDLGLVSFNDSHLCELLESGLTSVSLNIHKIVSIACRQLLDAINDEDEFVPRRRVVASELKIRGSSKR
jgi:DNA-binding LacI/PurR family transcriptional regulator